MTPRKPTANPAPRAISKKILTCTGEPAARPYKQYHSRDATRKPKGSFV